MIAYAGEGQKEVHGLLGNQVKRLVSTYMSSVSCAYALILCDYIMYMLWTSYTEGYISEMKAVWPATC